MVFLVEIPPPYGPVPKNIVLWFSGRKKSRCNSNSYSGTKYPKRGSNPHGCNSQGILSPSCLPFHHSGEKGTAKLSIFRQFTNNSIPFEFLKFGYQPYKYFLCIVKPIDRKMLYKTRLEKIFCCTGLAICLFACSEKGSRKITMETLLEEMTSFESVSRWPSPQYICLQTSSHDRRSVSPGEPGWFANDDGFGFIRTDTIDGRIEKVLFEESAPGAITRIWLTT